MISIALKVLAVGVGYVVGVWLINVIEVALTLLWGDDEHE